MDAIISTLTKNSANLPDAMFVTAFGLAGVFAVLAVFFVLIIVLEKAFRPKTEEPEKN